MKKKPSAPLVGIIMGSDSDWPTLQPAAEACASFDVACDKCASSPRIARHWRWWNTRARLHERGLRVIIAGAGGAAHLPGMVASITPLPVIGVPVESKALKGLDSLLSIVQMPGGVPVATVAIGGGRNAGLLAVQILGAHDERLRATRAKRLQGGARRRVTGKEPALAVWA